MLGNNHANIQSRPWNINSVHRKASFTVLIASLSRLIASWTPLLMAQAWGPTMATTSVSSGQLGIRDEQLGSIAGENRSAIASNYTYINPYKQYWYKFYPHSNQIAINAFITHPPIYLHTHTDTHTYTHTHRNTQTPVPVQDPLCRHI